MSYRVIEANRLEDALGSVLEGGTRLVAPVLRGRRVVFDAVDSTAEIARGHVNTDHPPKGLLFPRTEPVLSFEGEGPAVRLLDMIPDCPETVLFGVRPCDAAGIAMLEDVFAADPRDEFFLRRRAATTIVVVACGDPGPGCFCTAVGYGPGWREGADVFLTPVGPQGYAVEAETERGRALVGRIDDLLERRDDVEPAASIRDAERKLARTVPLHDLGPVLRERFDDPRWRDVGRACLGCGVCAYCCPTCHCFDLADEEAPGGGARVKFWDCCAFGTFTLHGSGHNPRPDQAARYRQRVLHKLSYFPERSGRSLCVGCGRCGALCPVGQDIYESASVFHTPEEG